MVSSSIIHGQKSPFIVECNANTKRHIKPVFKLRIVQRKIRRKRRVFQMFGNGNVITLRSLRRSNSVTRSPKTNQWVFFRFFNHLIIHRWDHFADHGIEFNSQQQSGRDLVSQVKTPLCSFDIKINKSSCERPLLFFVSRTEKPTLTGSPGSRGYSWRWLLPNGRNKQCKKVSENCQSFHG